MSYSMLSDNDLDRAEAIQKEKLNTHYRADRMEPRERTRMQACTWELAQISREWKRRMDARQDVTQGINTLKDRWSR